MKIVFDKEKHLYLVDSEPYPSVTQIISQTVPIPFQVAAWWGYKAAASGENPSQKRQSAALIGTRVHEAFAEMVVGNPVDDFDYEDLEGFLVAIEAFIEENQPAFCITEHQVASKRYRYAGTLDLVCMFHAGEYAGRYALVDVKTGRMYPDQHWPQLAAYKEAFREMRYGYGDDPVAYPPFILDLKATGKYRLIPVTDTFNDFKVLLDHYNSIQERKRRKKK